MARTLTQPRTEFARRMIAARERAQLKQIQVCERLQISQGTLSTLERVASGSTMLIAFARLYNVDPDWLYCGEGTMEPKKSRDTFSSDTEVLATTFEAIEDPVVRRRVFSICTLVMMNGDIPTPQSQAEMISRMMGLPASTAPSAKPARKTKKTA